jgi:ubiquinone/menaquinone biosynthesis C-methylase UbiE
MNNIEAYNKWSEDYDTVINKTRDIESLALRKVLSTISFKNVLEIGCGTGKNTEWLVNKAEKIIAVDFSEGMIAKAKKKIKNNKVKFIQSDIRDTWSYGNNFDLVTCSLVLEHIEDLDFIFQQVNRSLVISGYFYLGELHPFKQYLGTKARFENESGLVELECFTHNVSEFFYAARKNNFECTDLQEWFDDENKLKAPRLLSLIFTKKK